MTTSLLLAAGLAVSAAIGGVIVWGRVKEVKPNRIGRWSSSFPARIYAGAGVPVDKLAEAINWWNRHGYDLRIARSKMEANVLVVIDPTIDRRASVDDSTVDLGRTVLHTTQEGTVVGADVRLLPAPGSLAVTHEIGHVCGLAHPAFCPSGNMMHPSRPGWDDRGCHADD